MDWQGNKDYSGYSISTSCKCHVEDPNNQLADNAGQTDQLHKSAAFVRCCTYGTTRVYPCLCLEQCCGSGMFIPDPKSSTKERGEKKIVVIPILVATNFTKL